MRGEEQRSVDQVAGGWRVVPFSSGQETRSSFVWHRDLTENNGGGWTLIAAITWESQLVRKMHSKSLLEEIDREMVNRWPLPRLSYGTFFLRNREREISVSLSSASRGSMQLGCGWWPISLLFVWWFKFREMASQGKTLCVKSCSWRLRRLFAALSVEYKMRQMCIYVLQTWAGECEECERLEILSILSKIYLVSKCEKFNGGIWGGGEGDMGDTCNYLGHLSKNFPSFGRTRVQKST